MYQRVTESAVFRGGNFFKKEKGNQLLFTRHLDSQMIDSERSIYNTGRRLMDGVENEIHHHDILMILEKRKKNKKLFTLLFYHRKRDETFLTYEGHVRSVLVLLAAGVSC